MVHVQGLSIRLSYLSPELMHQTFDYHGPAGHQHSCFVLLYIAFLQFAVHYYPGIWSGDADPDHLSVAQIAGRPLNFQQHLLLM